MKKQSSKWASWYFVLPGLLLALIFALPILAILIEALASDLPGIFQKPQTISAIKVSLVTTGISTFFAIVLGTPLAYLMSRFSFRGQSFIELVVDLPIVLPPSVAGLGLLLVFGRQGWLGGAFDMLGVSIPFSTMAVVLAQLFVASPLFIRSARIGFASVHKSLIEAARTEGASSWQMFWTVMIPLSTQALFTGALMSWARALGEFGATILFAGNLSGITQTMPLAIYIGLESSRASAIGLSFLLLVLAAAFLILLRRIERFWSIR